jgi:hypothetical protein
MTLQWVARSTEIWQLRCRKGTRASSQDNDLPRRRSSRAGENAPIIPMETGRATVWLYEPMLGWWNLIPRQLHRVQ